MIIVGVIMLELFFHCQKAFEDKASTRNVSVSDIAWLLMVYIGVAILVCNIDTYMSAGGVMAMAAGLIRYMVDIRDCFLREKYKRCVERAIQKDDKKADRKGVKVTKNT